MWKIVEKLLVANFPDFPVTIKQNFLLTLKENVLFKQHKKLMINCKKQNETK